MEKELKRIAEKALKFLCIGSVVEGINFYGLKILLSENNTNKDRIDGQIFINIESRFTIYDSELEFFPTKEEELPELDWDESYQIICKLRLKEIVDIKLGMTSPHLLIYFESGEILFIFGHHSKYESWQVGTWYNTENDGNWEVIACPGDNLAIFAPEDIIR
jgi:hypothetical protein